MRALFPRPNLFQMWLSRTHQSRLSSCSGNSQTRRVWHLFWIGSSSSHLSKGPLLEHAAADIAGHAKCMVCGQLGHFMCQDMKWFFGLDGLTCFQLWTEHASWVSV
jgi:hypothetical protein